MPGNIGLPELLILLTPLWAFIGYKIAVSKNLPEWLGIVLGFFGGVIGLLVLAVIPRKNVGPVPPQPVQLPVDD